MICADPALTDMAPPRGREWPPHFSSAGRGQPSRGLTDFRADTGRLDRAVVGRSRLLGGVAFPARHAAAFQVGTADAGEMGAYDCW